MNTSKAQRFSNAARQMAEKACYLCCGVTERFPLILLVGGLVALIGVGLSGAAERTRANKVQVADSIVLPRRPVAESIADAMQFLKKADDGYVPGRIDGELAGYFTSAFVNEDGTRSERLLAYPARQHAYFIFTFLRYGAYTGNREWLLRARDLADWNLAHSTPSNAAYANLPYSTFSKGQPGGSKDQDSIEPDKVAFLGSAYVALYEATADTKYLDAGRAVAETLARRQREDGSWPFRVVPEDGTVRQDFGGAPVFLVEFFEKLLRYKEQPGWHRVHDRALKYMVQTNIEKDLWGTYHEDIALKPQGYLSAEPMCFTADYLFRRGKTHPEYVEMGRRVIRRMEERLVHTKGHAAAPAPAVAEQAGFNHIMPGHTARYCLALAHLYSLTHDEQVKRRAMSGVNALTHMQAPSGLFRTFFYSVNPRASKTKRPDWYSQHLYTVCHVLEAMPCLPELAPNGQDHLLGGNVFTRDVQYSATQVRFETIAPSRTVLKLSFVPKAVYAGARELGAVKELPAGDHVGWSFDPVTSLLTIRHGYGQVEVLSSPRK